MAEDIDVAPIDYLVVEFPGSKMTGEAFPILVDLADRGIVRILDLLFVKRELDGTVRGLALTDLDSDGTLDLAVFEGASSGLLGDDDVNEAAAAILPGNSAAGPFVSALRRSGAELVASGRIPVADVLAALDAAEAKS
jgi:hypothetical protein